VSSHSILLEIHYTNGQYRQFIIEPGGNWTLSPTIGGSPDSLVIREGSGGLPSIGIPLANIAYYKVQKIEESEHKGQDASLDYMDKLDEADEADGDWDVGASNPEPQMKLVVELGLATTRQLLTELKARSQVDLSQGRKNTVNLGDGKIYWLVDIIGMALMQLSKKTLDYTTFKGE